MKNNLTIKEIGRVIQISGAVIKIEGLPYIGQEEIVKIGKESAVILQFDEEFTEALVNENMAYALVLGEYTTIHIGDTVERTNRILNIPVGNELLGSIIDPLGRNLDTNKEVQTKQKQLLERQSPGIMQRELIRQPLETGIKVVDALFPIGRGQRELIVGDRKTGKTSLALGAILNQSDVISIYVAIGQRRTETARIIRVLKDKNALRRSIMIIASSSVSPVLRYIAPFSAMTIAESFRDQGKHVLIIFDDLTKHAWAWRELSLSLGRPPGREAYPGDIFYLHARLLERAAKLNKQHGGGSITALPICETKEGDISEYIPTNLISITDGQLYLRNDLFEQGQKPAVDIGLSVSRIGAQAQPVYLREATKGLKLILSQHQELKKLVRLETKISPRAQIRFKRGELLLEIFKQSKYNSVDSVNQSIIYTAITEGLLDDVDIKDISSLESNLYSFINDLHQDFKAIIIKNGWQKNTKAQLGKIITDFKLTQ